MRIMGIDIPDPVKYQCIYCRKNIQSLGMKGTVPICQKCQWKARRTK